MACRSALPSGRASCERAGQRSIAGGVGLRTFLGGCCCEGCCCGGPWCPMRCALSCLFAGVSALSLTTDVLELVRE